MYSKEVSMLDQVSYVNDNVRYIGKVNSTQPITLDEPEETVVITDKMQVNGDITLRVANLVVLAPIVTPYDIRIVHSGFFLNLSTIGCRDKTTVIPTYNNVNQDIINRVNSVGVPLLIRDNSLILTTVFPLDWEHNYAESARDHAMEHSESLPN